MNSRITEIAMALIASGKNYAYIEGATRSMLPLRDNADLDYFMERVAKTEAKAIVDMALEINRLLTVIESAT